MQAIGELARPGRVNAWSPRLWPERWRIGVVLGVTLASAGVLFLFRAFTLDPSYHAFADARTVLGVPHGLNVLSNLAFAIVGIAGLWSLLGGAAHFRHRSERLPWIVLFVGVALTSVGSSWYHLNPSDESLLWDRLPMAIGFMGLLAAVVAERVQPRAGILLLGPAVAFGLASVLYWFFTERAGAGDLRPYAIVQGGPLLIILLLMALFPSTYTLSLALLGALGTYALAKLAEIGDEWVWGLGGVVSGHTLKHLLSAAAIGILVWMLVRRRSIAAPAAQHRTG